MGTQARVATGQGRSLVGPPPVSVGSNGNRPPSARTLRRRRKLDMARQGQDAVGARMKAAARAKGYEIKSMARALGVSVTSLYRYYSGETEPKPETIARFAALVGEDPKKFTLAHPEPTSEMMAELLLRIVDLAMAGTTPSAALLQIAPQTKLSVREERRLNSRDAVLRHYLDRIARDYYRRAWGDLHPEERFQVVADLVEAARPSE